jgi:uncharacterized protein (DUF1330 family)
MPAYIIARIDVTDPNQYRRYTDATPAVIERFGGKFIIRGGEVATLEGPQETRRIVVIEFPTVERAKEFFNSEEYSKVKQLREGAATGQFLAIEGRSI